MTMRGSFIINGAERVIVSQLHRSPGVVFAESTHANGTKLFSARVIPFKGSWVEFTTDINDLLYAYVDRKKKFFFSTLLRALGFSEKIKMLELFNLTEKVSIKEKTYLDYIGRITAENVIDKETGVDLEIPENTRLTDEQLLTILQSGLSSLNLLREDVTDGERVIFNTIMADNEYDYEDELKPVETPTKKSKAVQFYSDEGESAKSYIEKQFFNPKKYDLSDVGDIN
jgi:DNA-directed RNA polymerase, beta subunit/140 kD subunit